MSFLQQKWMLILSMVALSTYLQAQEQITSMTLEDAINYALAESPTIKEAQINIADAEAQIDERKSVGLPQLNGSVNFQRYLEIPVQPLPEEFDIFGPLGRPILGIADDIGSENLSGQTNEQLQILNSILNAPQGDGVSFFRKNNLTAAVNLDAMIFDGTYFVALRAAREYRNYVQVDYANKRRTVENRVIDAYLPVLFLQENIELLDKNIQNLEKLFFETKELYEAGFAEQLDIDRQELSLANLTIERDALRRQLENAKAALKFSMNYPLESELLIEDDLEEMALQLSDDVLQGKYNYTARPEYQVATSGISLNELNIKQYRSGYLPSLRASAVYQQQYQGDSFSDGFWAPTAFVGLTLNVPIFDGLMKEAQIQRAKLQLELAEVQRKELGRLIDLEVETSRKTYLSALESYDNQRKNLELAERIYNTTQVKYREGVGSSLEVTQAEQSLYSTQSNYMQAIYDLLQAKINVEKALGR
ncbi:MAG: TolC family protein [Saprospiraceae bacterium]|nr:TolC family protein [Saprospiraceae bacterium]